MAALMETENERGATNLVKGESEIQTDRAEITKAE